MARSLNIITYPLAKETKTKATINRTSALGTKQGLVFEENGDIRYYENGKPIDKGLVRDGEGNYYFINSTLKAVKNCNYAFTTEKGNGLLAGGKYSFGEDGKLINLNIKNGVYHEADGTIRYYRNGYAFYEGIAKDSEGDYYYFDSSLKAVKNGSYYFTDEKGNGLIAGGTRRFDEEGKLQGVTIKAGYGTNGKDELHFYENGDIAYFSYNIIKNDVTVKDKNTGYIYYIGRNYRAVKNKTQLIKKDKTDNLFPEGYYSFDEEGRMIIKEGIWRDFDGETRYYVENQSVAQGLAQDTEGNYYFINSTKKAVKNCYYAFSAESANGLLPAGKYFFGKDGKLVFKNGLVFEENGDVRYYENGVAVARGLVQDNEGNYYFINSTKKAVKNCRYAFSAENANSLLPAGAYNFDSDGKLIA